MISGADLGATTAEKQEDNPPVRKLWGYVAKKRVVILMGPGRAAPHDFYYANYLAMGPRIR